MATQRSSFTALEVEGMPDDELLQNFARITGKKCLSCKHCHSEKVELKSFVIVLRKWCLKKMNKGFQIFGFVLFFQNQKQTFLARHF